MTLVCSSRASSHSCRPRTQHTHNPRHNSTQCPRLRCLLVAEAFLQPGDQRMHRLPASCARVCRPSSTCPCKRASDYAGLLRLAWWARGLICERRHWRVGAGCGCGRRHLAYGPSVLLRGAKTNRKHPSHKSSRSSLMVLASRRGPAADQSNLPSA